MADSPERPRRRWVPPRFTIGRLLLALIWFSVSFALLFVDSNPLPGNITGTLIFSSVCFVAGTVAFGVAVGTLYARDAKGAAIGLAVGLLLLAAIFVAAFTMS